MRRVRFASLALADLENIAACIGRDNVEAARRVVNRIEEMCFALRDFPELGVRSEVSGARKLVVPGLRYKIMHEIFEETSTIVILRVYHGARDVRS